MALPAATTALSTGPGSHRWAWLPPIGSWRYYALLGLLGTLILGPLGGITASYMNFSLGFFIGGQVLAGILASVAGMAGMGVLLQAMVWLGLPALPTWELMLYMGAIGMFGAGVGMLYTPI